MNMDTALTLAALTNGEARDMGGNHWLVVRRHQNEVLVSDERITMAYASDTMLKNGFHLCRAEACGCYCGHCGQYCSMCAEYTPICPSCGAVYGEHRLGCEVADGYHDCGEGPWPTHEMAEAFAIAEVGLPWDIAKGNRGFYVLVKDE